MSLLHKTENQKKNNDPIIRLMTPMIAGILACVFCLVSMTWAWFTASVNTKPQTIQSATRSTSVMVYEVVQSEGENRSVTKTLVNPEISEEISLHENTQADDDEGVIIEDNAVVWELSPEKTYEVILKGSGTASTGYCKVALSHTVSGSDTPETKLYTTSAFEQEKTIRFTYNTGGFSDAEGVTQTQYMDYVENTTAPTLAIASYWGSPAEETEEQISLMSLRSGSQEIMLLSDGDVLGLAPIQCPEAKAETEIELEGFEIQEGAEISAEEDYQISLTLKEGYEMPTEVVVNINGKDYVVSTGGAEANDEAPHYDTQTGVLTVPSSLLSDGATVSVKATATPVQPEPVEEVTEETPEETTEEETTDNNETEQDNSTGTTSGNRVVADDPAKKEEDSEQNNDEPEKTPAGDGGDDDDVDDNDSNDSSTEDTSSDSNEDETEDEKADVTLNLSQLTINLEETQIPTNADLVFTLSAKEDMELPEKIVITLDKTIRDENIDDEKITEDEEIIEDKTEYVINTDGKDNPDGFEFDAESGELKISSELLKGVHEITIADIEQSAIVEDDEKAEISFEVKNLTFDFTDDEISTDEDIVIIFTAGEDYELPETIMITIDGEEYIIYTSEEDSDKNPEGITFDTETGTLTISKDLLEGAESITITAEGVKKEDDESQEENSEADSKEEPENSETDNKENETEDVEDTESETDSSEAEDKKEAENETDDPATGNKTETEGGTEAEGRGTTDTTNPETDSDNTVEDENAGETGETEPETDTSTPVEADVENGTDSEQGADDESTEENDQGENNTEETIEPTPDAESGDEGKTDTSTEPTAPVDPSEPVATPGSSKTEESDTNGPTTNGNDDSNSETTNTDDSSVESVNNGDNSSTEGNGSSESTTPSLSNVVSTTPLTSVPVANKTSTSSVNTQIGSNTSGALDSSAPAVSTNSNSNEASKSSDKAPSSEE